MNRNSWEAAQRSSAVGIELNNQFYNQLRAATRAALDAEGVTLDNLTAAADTAQQDSLEQQRLQEEAERAEKNERLNNTLFLTAATSLLPRVSDSLYDFGQRLYFKTTDRQEAYDILDSVVWLQKQPYWLAGYRYTDNSALLLPAAPEPAYYTAGLRDFFSTHKYGDHPYNQVFEPFRKELHLSSYDGQTGPLSLRLHRVPASMRFAVKATEAYTFTPARKDRKAFKKYATVEARLETMELIDDVYDHDARAFVINAQSPRVISLQNMYGSLAATEGAITGNTVSTNLFSKYNVFECLVRLMSRFDKGQEYLELIQQAKERNIEQVVMQQQGIPNLPSRAAIEEYLKEKHKAWYGY